MPAADQPGQQPFAVPRLGIEVAGFPHAPPERLDVEVVAIVTDEVRAALDAARLAAGAGDVATAEGRLQLATAILINLQTYLRSRA